MPQGGRDQRIWSEGIGLSFRVVCALHLEIVKDLSGEGIERFSTRKHEWRLNVHGVVIVVDAPTVVVRTALAIAGFDANRSWLIYFKVVGQPKREVGLDDVLDLETPGIEKSRLFPRNFDNGEALRRRCEPSR